MVSNDSYVLHSVAYLRTPVLWRERTMTSVAAIELSASACNVHVMYQSHCHDGIQSNVSRTRHRLRTANWVLNLIQYLVDSLRWSERRRFLTAIALPTLKPRWLREAIRHHSRRDDASHIPTPEACNHIGQPGSMLRCARQDISPKNTVTHVSWDWAGQRYRP